MIKIKANSQEEINREFKSRALEVKQSVIEAVIDALDNNCTHADFAKLIPTNIILRVEQSEFLSALKNNMDVLIEKELYEKAAAARDWIKKLQSEPNILK